MSTWKDLIKDAKELLDVGAITAEEFEEAKQKAFVVRDNSINPSAIPRPTSPSRQDTLMGSTSRNIKIATALVLGYVGLQWNEAQTLESRAQAMGWNVEVPVFGHGEFVSQVAESERLKSDVKSIESKHGVIFGFPYSDEMLIGLDEGLEKMSNAGADLSTIDFSTIDFSTIDFSTIDFSTIDFSNVDVDKWLSLRPMLNVKKIPSGRFQMGCTSGDSACYDWEKPVHTVEISRAFYLMESEVTQGLYESVMGSNPSYFKGSSLPVEKVSWFDAVQFANKLSAKEGLEQCYSISGDTVSWSNKDCNGWRLPTEAEWEYAARGSESYKYAGSSSVKAVAWYGGSVYGHLKWVYQATGNSRNKTHSVCTKQKNGYGLCDMSGNVWEWVWDWYDDDESLYGSHADRGTVRDPYGANSGWSRVSRGGSWDSNARGSRVSLRNYSSPYGGGSNVGFRLGRTH